MRNHRTRWLLVFYYPHAVSVDMGPSAILPGAHLTTIHPSDRNHDFLEDEMENFARHSDVLNDPVYQSNRHAAGVWSAEQSPEVLAQRDELHGRGEAVAVEQLGAMREEQQSHTADKPQLLNGVNPGRGEFKVLAQSGTMLVMHYGMFHRGCRHLPAGLWRNMFKLQYFRCSSPVCASWNHAEDSSPRPFEYLHTTTRSMHRAAL
jgi:hypothetical protein